MKPIERAIDAAGGRQALADKLGVTNQAVEKWVRFNRVPAERVLSIEAATDSKVTRHELRPDLYPQEGSSQQTAASA